MAALLGPDNCYGHQRFENSLLVRPSGTKFRASNCCVCSMTFGSSPSESFAFGSSPSESLSLGHLRQSHLLLGHLRQSHYLWVISVRVICFWVISVRVTCFWVISVSHLLLGHLSQSHLLLCSDAFGKLFPLQKKDGFLTREPTTSFITTYLKKINMYIYIPVI